MGDIGAGPRRSADDDWARVVAWVQFLLGGFAGAAACTASLAVLGLHDSRVDRAELLVLVAILVLVVGIGTLLARSVGGLAPSNPGWWVPATGGALIGVVGSLGSAIFSAAVVFFGS